MKGGGSGHSHQIPTQSSQETCAFQIWGAEEPSQGLSYDAKGLWKGFNFFLNHRNGIWRVETKYVVRAIRK